MRRNRIEIDGVLYERVVREARDYGLPKGVAPMDLRYSLVRRVDGSTWGHDHSLRGRPTYLWTEDDGYHFIASADSGRGGFLVLELVLSPDRRGFRFGDTYFDAIPERNGHVYAHVNPDGKSGRPIDVTDVADDLIDRVYGMVSDLRDGDESGFRRFNSQLRGIGSKLRKSS